MQLQWAEKAESILKMGRRPQFQFVQDKADVATNMFGKHIDLLNQDENLLKNHRR